MNNNLKEARETLKELIVGIVLYGILLCIGSIILFQGQYSIACGIGLGAFGAIMIAVHIFWSLNRSLDLGEDGAVKRERVMVVLRMIIMGLIAAVGIIFSQQFHILGIFVGLLGLKISAYLQPLLHNYILKPKEKGEGR